MIGAGVGWVVRVEEEGWAKVVVVCKQRRVYEGYFVFVQTEMGIRD